MRKIIFAALAATTIATPAFAQDVADTGGFRIEAIGGYESQDVEGDSTEGVVYGLGVGYDISTGGGLFGIEGEFSDSNSDECVANVDVTGDELCGAFGRDLYVGARFGANVGGNTVLYGKAGYTNARVKLIYDDGTVAGLDDFDEGANLDGIRVGGGLQFGLGTGSYAKVEYRYSNYESGFEKHQGVVGVGFRF
jgi:outer membrane immunogenic protein